ncbi:hypothetical protein ACFRCQ_28105 [Cytobacillus firmus]|uniref:hypothetical protein n=1 Tax=Cytobacillus firmus TaxID=1399 RepID=UPI00369CB8EA
MKLNELIKQINKSVEDYDYSSARKYIEENIEILETKKQLLKSNAREILKFLVEQSKMGVEPLSRKELNIINAINAYAYKFDLRGIKVLVKENAKLFIREEIIAYLNNDAKTILTGMGVIKN